MMMDPILHFLCRSRYLRGLDKPSHPRKGLGLHVSHQNDSTLTADFATDVNNGKVAGSASRKTSSMD
jgi:hypothetical protein